MIFIDRSIPRAVAGALKQVRDDVRWLEDEFPHDVDEKTWLADVGQRGWLVISRDKKIRSPPGERKALTDANVGCFIVTQKQPLSRLGYLKLLVASLDQLVASLDQMEQVFGDTPRPFLF